MIRSAAVWAMAAKDMRAILKNTQVWLPMLVVPLVIGVVLPSALVLIVLRSVGQQAADLTGLLDMIPPGALADQLATLPGLPEKAAFFLANYLLAPFFLLIPLMAASTVSADSLAGEKERGTLESLLFSPVSVTEIFLGKSLAAFLPALALAWSTFLVTAITLNAAAWPDYGRVFFPTLNWLPLLLLVIPLLALGVIFMSVFISARVGTFQAAYQLGGLVVLPVIALIAGQVTGVLLLGFGVILWLALALLLIDVALLLLLRRFLDRPQLFEGQVR